MIALFHSPVKGQAGCTSSLAAIACVISGKFKKNTLVVQFQDDNIPIEKLLFKKEMEGTQIKAQEEDFDDEGIDALMRRVANQSLEKRHFDDCCLNTLSGNKKLNILSVTKKPQLENNLLLHFDDVKEFLKKADKNYETVLILAPNTGSKLTQEILSLQEINVTSVMCVPQSMLYLEKLKRTSNEILLVGNYDADSKYSLKNIASKYGFKQGKLGGILHNAKFKDACSEGNIFNFVMKNLENEPDDDIFNFSKYLIESAGKILAQDDKRFTNFLPLKENLSILEETEFKEEIKTELMGAV